MEDLIKKLQSDPAFQGFAKYIISKIEELDTVNGLDKMTNEEAGEEVKIRSRTKEKLYKILEPFIGYKEKSKPTEEAIKKAESKYGL
jgi:hypothetical protein